MEPVYAVRHKNGNYLPVTGRGSTHYEFDKPVKSPRLFNHKQAAKNFVLCWVKGKARVYREEPYGPDFIDDGDEYVDYEDVGRKASDLQVVALQLVEL